MKIMLTGATGFIGNSLLNRLVQQHYQINVLCRSSDNRFLNKPNINLFIGNLNDIKSIEKCMNGCSQVYHLAAYARNWAKNKALFFQSNNRGFENILQSAVNNKIKRILFMSTSVTFGPSNRDPVDENKFRSVPPLTLYEASKIEAEKTVQKYLQKGLDIVTVNPTRLFGPGLLTEGNSVTKMIDLYLKGKFRFILGDGNAVGNYAFIDNVVSGCINAMDKGRSGEKYILGGENLSYNEFFSVISNFSEKSYKMLHIPESLGLAYSYFEKFFAQISDHYPAITSDWVKTFAINWAFSSDKAVHELNYKITPFEQALVKTINWINFINSNHGAENESIKFA